MMNTTITSAKENSEPSALRSWVLFFLTLLAAFIAWNVAEALGADTLFQVVIAVFVLAINRDIREGFIEGIMTNLNREAAPTSCEDREIIDDNGGDYSIGHEKGWGYDSDGNYTYGWKLHPGSHRLR